MLDDVLLSRDNCPFARPGAERRRAHRVEEVSAPTPLLSELVRQRNGHTASMVDGGLVVML